MIRDPLEIADPASTQAATAPLPLKKPAPAPTRAHMRVIIALLAVIALKGCDPAIRVLNSALSQLSPTEASQRMHQADNGDSRSGASWRVQTEAIEVIDDLYDAAAEEDDPKARARKAAAIGGIERHARLRRQQLLGEVPTSPR